MFVEKTPTGVHRLASITLVPAGREHVQGGPPSATAHVPARIYGTSCHTPLGGVFPDIRTVGERDAAALRAIEEEREAIQARHRELHIAEKGILAVAFMEGSPLTLKQAETLSKQPKMEYATP